MSVDNPRIWVNADVKVAPVGTTAPNNVASDWDAAWKSLGLLSEDGLEESREQDRTDHFAYGGVHVRTTRSKFKREFKVMALEDTPVVFDLVNPGSSATTSNGVTTRTVKNPDGPNPKAFAFELKDGDVITRRVIPNGEVIEVGSRTIVDDELSVYELTIVVYPDNDGVLYYDITNDTQAVVSA